METACKMYKSAPLITDFIHMKPLKFIGMVTASSIVLCLFSSPQIYAITYPSLDVSKPVFASLEGERVNQVRIGEQVVIMETIRNNVYLSEEKSMVGLVEIRDQEGLTLFLAYQTMEISPNGNYTFGVSWRPDSGLANGTYLVRAWALSSFANDADALSNVIESQISVA
ncbi:MAG: hypothetical protein ACREBU_01185 [Nitrososphaera sp.]